MYKCFFVGNHTGFEIGNIIVNSISLWSLVNNKGAWITDSHENGP